MPLNLHESRQQHKFSGRGEGASQPTTKNPSTIMNTTLIEDSTATIFGFNEPPTTKELKAHYCTVKT